MNATSRIQDQYSIQQKKILVSEEWMYLLEDTSDYSYSILNDIELKGKQSLVKIFSVTNNTTEAKN